MTNGAHHDGISIHSIFMAAQNEEKTMQGHQNETDDTRSYYINPDKPFYSDPDDEPQDFTDQLSTALTTPGITPKFIADLGDTIVEGIVDDCDPESELAAIIISSLKDPHEAGIRLAKLAEAKVIKYADDNPDEVCEFFNPGLGDD